MTEPDSKAQRREIYTTWIESVNRKHDHAESRPVWACITTERKHCTPKEIDRLFGPRDFQQS